MCMQPNVIPLTPQDHFFQQLENATHCGVRLSEQLKSVVGFFQLKMVLFDFAKNAGILTLSGLGVED